MLARRSHLAVLVSMTVALGNVTCTDSLTTSDTTPPSTITDLTPFDGDAGQVFLTWTAPRHQGSFVGAATYDLRYSLITPISDANWNRECTGPGPQNPPGGCTRRVSALPTPSAPGATDSVLVTGLDTYWQYHFALKASDTASRESRLSNLASCTTHGLNTAAGTYGISMSGSPRFTKATYSPLYNVRPGKTQVVTVDAQDDNGNPITAVTVTFFTDNGSASLTLSLVRGTAVNGTWEGSYTVADTHCVKYQADLKASSASGTSSTVGTFKPLP